jgi:hypothetical protein
VWRHRFSLPNVIAIGTVSTKHGLVPLQGSQSHFGFAVLGLGGAQRFTIALEFELCHSELQTLLSFQQVANQFHQSILIEGRLLSLHSLLRRLFLVQRFQPVTQMWFRNFHLYYYFS